jgi:hypothetical protein
VVDGGGLENRFPERGRGFESYSLRHAPRGVHGRPELCVVQGAIFGTCKVRVGAEPKVV